MILAGDTGGTKTRLALFDVENDSKGEVKLVKRQHEVFESRFAPTLEDIVHAFLTKVGTAQGQVTAACFGVPGPVSKGTVITPNLPWTLSETELSRSLGVPKVRLINDLAAKAATLPRLKSEDVVTLFEGSSERDRNVFAILAPGTGTGVAYLHVADGKYYPMPSEGGHVEFAPVDDIQIDLLKYLAKKFDRVSIERVLCGNGLLNIYNFLRDTGFATESDELKRRMSQQDPAAVIAEEGISGRYELCSKAMDIFATVIGSVAGDLVLTYLATGGVYLGGGIPPKIIKKLSRGTTVAAYLKKGRLSRVVQMTPLYVIKEDNTTLLGAASVASML
jgi:glucokinase